MELDTDSQKRQRNNDGQRDRVFRQIDKHAQRKKYGEMGNWIQTVKETEEE